MSVIGWEADRPLNAELAAAAIRTCFPSVDAGTPSQLGSGWEFDAYLTGDGWVFRFPRRSHVGALFERERPVVDLARSVLPPDVAVPTVELMGSPTSAFPYPFAGHRLIEGVAADELPPHCLERLAPRLGAALGAIHAAPLHAARSAGLAEMDLDDVGKRQWIDRGLDGAHRLRGLIPELDDALDLLEQDETIPTYAGPPCFIHQDISPDHLVCDPRSGELRGILDWTDATLGDPARDFVTLVAFGGRAFVEAVLAAYAPGPDAAFRSRLGAMARLLTVIWMAHAHERSIDVAKHARWIRNAFAAPAD